jgi:chromosome segregation ATPase
MTAEPDTLVEAEQILRRLGDRRRELRERVAELKREIEGAAAADQADVDRRVQAILAGEAGLAVRRSVGRLLDDLAEAEDELRLTERAIDQAKTEVAAARRREARRKAAELQPEHDEVARRIVAALEELAAAQARERELHALVGADRPILVELGRVIPGVDHLLARAREVLASKTRAAA